jgi:hypothetical protein
VTRSPARHRRAPGREPTAGVTVAGGAVAVVSALLLLGPLAGLLGLAGGAVERSHTLVAFFAHLGLFEAMWIAAGIGCARRRPWAREWILWASLPRLFLFANVAAGAIGRRDATAIAMAASLLVGPAVAFHLQRDRVAAQFPPAAWRVRLWMAGLALAWLVVPFVAGGFSGVARTAAPG